MSIMNALWERMPSVNLIKNEEIRKKTIECWELAVTRSVFAPEEIKDIGFTFDTGLPCRSSSSHRERGERSLYTRKISYGA